MRRTATPSFSSLSSATISIKCLLILLVVSLSILLIAPIQVVQGTIEVEEEEPIQALSTGENPSDFVRNKIDSHDVSTACTVLVCSTQCREMLLLRSFVIYTYI